MLASSREDDLLNKLKSCVGGLKQDPSQRQNPGQTSRTNQNYNSSSQHYSSLHVSNQKIQQPYQTSYERQPLAPNMNTLRPPRKPELEQQDPLKSKLQYEMPPPSSRSYQSQHLMAAQNRNYGASIESTFNPSAFVREEQVPKPSSFRIQQDNFNKKKPYSIEQEIVAKHQAYRLGQDVTTKQRSYSNVNNLSPAPQITKQGTNRYERQYGQYAVAKAQAEQRAVKPQMNNYINQDHRQSSVKNDIARRYSLMQIQKTTLPYRQQVLPNFKQPSEKPYPRSYGENPTTTYHPKQIPNENKLYSKPTVYTPYSRQKSNIVPRQTQPVRPTRKVSKGYQQELEQRRNLLEQDIDRTVQRVSQTARKDINPGTIRKDISSSIKHDVSASTRKQPMQNTFVDYRNRRESLSQQIPLASNKPEPALPLREALNLSLKDQGECSALGKLKKISELNEKINDRIRNIINVFEDHK